MKIDAYNFKLYRLIVGAFFLRHGVLLVLVLVLLVSLETYVTGY